MSYKALPYSQVLRSRSLEGNTSSILGTRIEGPTDWHTHRRASSFGGQNWLAGGPLRGGIPLAECQKSRWNALQNHLIYAVLSYFTCIFCIALTVDLCCFCENKHGSESGSVRTSMVVRAGVWERKKGSKRAREQEWKSQESRREGERGGDQWTEQTDKCERDVINGQTGQTNQIEKKNQSDGQTSPQLVFNQW